MLCQKHIPHNQIYPLNFHSNINLQQAFGRLKEAHSLQERYAGLTPRTDLLAYLLTYLLT